MTLKKIVMATALLTAANLALADGNNCPNITHQQLTDALKANIAPTGGPSNGGLDFHMWASVVSPDGVVCLVTKSGDNLNDQWMGSRIISAQKAYTAIAFSTPTFALSTANLFAAVQPGGSLYGLQFSNPIDTKMAYRGGGDKFGTSKDPMVGTRTGGVNIFGGGLALYDSDGNLVGALGVSGDTSCADHNVAWRVRSALGLNNVPGGVSSHNDDNIIYDAPGGRDAGNNNGKIDGFEHADCGNSEKTVNAGL